MDRNVLVWRYPRKHNQDRTVRFLKAFRYQNRELHFASLKFFELLISIYDDRIEAPMREGCKKCLLETERCVEYFD